MRKDKLEGGHSVMTNEPKSSIHSPDVTSDLASHSN